MQIVSIGDNLHEKSKPVSGKNKNISLGRLQKFLPNMLSGNTFLPTSGDNAPCACASIQTDQSLCSPQEHAIEPWLSTDWTVYWSVCAYTQTNLSIRCAQISKGIFSLGIDHLFHLFYLLWFQECLLTMMYRGIPMFSIEIPVFPMWRHGQ